MNPQKPAREPALNFEKSLKQLEAIVKKLEQEEVPLEVSIKLYEEGKALERACEQQLRAAENRIRQLTETPSGEVKEADFEPSAAENPPAGDAHETETGKPGSNKEDLPF
ncbi:exodeoxyribonuclease VII small subunit [bacterium]|nr:exodeoxyribonuclease VII small subunit [bacterium]